MVYDITRPSSFESLTRWIRSINECSNSDVEKMILGNKCDIEEQRQISKESGEAIAKQNGIPFLETSAKSNINIETAFIQISERILYKKAGPIHEVSPTIVPKPIPESPTSPKCC